MDQKFEEAIRQIDERNAEDPNKETYNGESFPKELLYAQRMHHQLLAFAPEASEELQLAARAQHICRWQIPRSDYPKDRVGYLKWRNDLKKLHAEITTEILEKVGYGAEFVDRVSFLIQKKNIKRDDESQTLEDVICLVFLQYYFADFAAKHEEEKVVDILRKTWAKMSEKGQQAALKLELPDAASHYVHLALS